MTEFIIADSLQLIGNNWQPKRFTVPTNEVASK